MIVVNISDGLGNQLFQYAAARSLSLLHSTKLFGDPVAYSPRYKPQREFILNDLGLPMNFREIPRHIFVTWRGYSRIRRNILDGFRTKYMCEGRYNENFGLLPDDVLLLGYFQDLKYFERDRGLIIREISESLCRFVQKKGLNHPPVGNDVAAIHVRRGDYLLNPRWYSSWHEQYYKSIVPYLLQKCDVSVVHVFTDDQIWCRKIFGYLGKKVKIFAPDKRFGGIGDLVQMSRYSTLSITNSTYSWWAGTLASANGSHVIAPSRWTEGLKSPSASLYIQSWQCFSPSDEE